MKSLAEKLLAHYAQHPPNLAGAESILDMLCWNYTESNPIEGDHSRHKFKAIRERLSFLNPNNYEEVFNLICDLCVDVERQAFREGIRFGMLLMRELQSE